MISLFSELTLIFTGGFDYLFYSSNSTITFPADSAVDTEICFTFGRVIDDGWYEPLRGYASFILIPKFFTDTFVGGNNSFEVSIVNDERKYCSLNVLICAHVCVYGYH